MSDITEEEEENELFTVRVKEDSVRVEFETEKKEEEDGNEEVTLIEGSDDEEVSPSITSDRLVREVLWMSLTWLSGRRMRSIGS